MGWKFFFFFFFFELRKGQRAKKKKRDIARGRLGERSELPSSNFRSTGRRSESDRHTHIHTQRERESQEEEKEKEEDWVDRRHAVEGDGSMGST